MCQALLPCVIASHELSLIAHHCGTSIWYHQPRGEERAQRVHGLPRGTQLCGRHSVADWNTAFLVWDLSALPNCRGCGTWKGMELPEADR